MDSFRAFISVNSDRPAMWRDTF